jgi:hypothetical protein
MLANIGDGGMGEGGREQEMDKIHKETPADIRKVKKGRESAKIFEKPRKIFFY